MLRDRSSLGTPLGVDGPWLAAILSVLDEIADTLSDLRGRFPVDGGGPAPNPAPEVDVAHVVPVSEPAPDKPPAAPVADPGEADDDRGGEGATPVADPDQGLPPPPPRAGRGASAAAWQQWATTAGVAVADGAGRDDIIAACEQAGVIDHQ